MAGSSSAIRAGRAFIELFADPSKLGKDLRAAASQIKSWGASINKVGAFIGQGIDQAFKVIKKGSKIAGIALAGVGAGLLAGAKNFADSERAFMTADQVKAANALHESFGLLGDSATALSNTFFSALQPAFSAVIDIVRLGMNSFRSWIQQNPELVASVNGVVSGIRDALSAGNLKLAADILWAGLKLAWKTGVLALEEAWLDWKTSFQQTAIDAFFGIQEAMNNAWAAIKTSVADVAGWIVDKWLDAFKQLMSAIIDLEVMFGRIGKDEEFAKRLGLGLFVDAAKNRTKETVKGTNADTEKNRQKTEEQLAEANKAANEAIAQGNLDALQAARREIEAAKSELERMKAAAKVGAQPIGKDIIRAREFTTSVAGTFSSQALSGLGIGQAKQVEEQKKTNEKLDNVVDAIIDLPSKLPINGGLAFV